MVGWETMGAVASAFLQSSRRIPRHRIPDPPQDGAAVMRALLAARAEPVHGWPATEAGSEEGEGGGAAAQNYSQSL